MNKRDFLLRSLFFGMNNEFLFGDFLRNHSNQLGVNFNNNTYVNLLYKILEIPPHSTSLRAGTRKFYSNCFAIGNFLGRNDGRDFRHLDRSLIYEAERNKSNEVERSPELYPTIFYEIPPRENSIPIALQLGIFLVGMTAGFWNFLGLNDSCILNNIKIQK